MELSRLLLIYIDGLRRIQVPLKLYISGKTVPETICRGEFGDVISFLRNRGLLPNIQTD